MKILLLLTIPLILAHAATKISTDKQTRLNKTTKSYEIQSKEIHDRLNSID